MACSSRTGKNVVCGVLIGSGDLSGRIKEKGLLGLHTRSLRALSGHSASGGGWQLAWEPALRGHTGQRTFGCFTLRQ